MASQRIGCIVGLGNPGQRYAATRHNVGFRFVDEVAHVHGGQFRADAKFQGELCQVFIAESGCWLLKPTTYMNVSGRSVGAFASYYKLWRDSIMIVHDDLDLSPGTIKLKQGGGHGGHNGLRDVINALGGPGFLRLRVGIGHPGHRDQVVDYVLKRAAKEEEDATNMALTRALGVLPNVVKGQLQNAMNELHR